MVVPLPMRSRPVAMSCWFFWMTKCLPLSWWPTLPCSLLWRSLGNGLSSHTSAPLPSAWWWLLAIPAFANTWQQVLERQAAPVGVVVHPRTWLSPSAQLSPGCVVDHDAICGAYSQLGINASMAGGSRLGLLAALAAGEVLSCGESRCAELQLAPGAADLSEGLSCHGSAP